MDFGVAGKASGTVRAVGPVLSAATSWAASALRGYGAAGLGPSAEPKLQRTWHWENRSRKQIPKVIFSLTSMDQVLVITSVLFSLVSSGRDVCDSAAPCL